MIDIRKSLTKYRDCTENILNLLESDDFDLINEAMQTRQQILDEILKDGYKKNEVKQISDELQLEQIENKANALMHEKMQFIKKQIQQISQKKVAVNAYNNIGHGANIFSKKL